MPLSAELHAHTAELGLVSLYVPDIDRAAGGLDADLSATGTLGAPTLSGVVKVTNGEIDVYQVNLSLREIGSAGALGDSGIDFSGSAHAGTGAVSASGHLEWRRLLPYGKFHLQGTNLRVADVPEAQIDASPDLDFAVDGRRIEVSGKVTVPYAKIQPKDITNAVRASPDEVIVGAEPENAAERFEVVSTITLVLGDHVNLDAMGLTARLTGSVTIRSGYEAITRGTGELSVAEGTYTAYARKLDIQRGQLIFTGGAIDDPGIDVRAQKQFPDVTAGVNVRGTLLQPHMSFFSDPPLPQSQIVSLILAGGSLKSAQNPSNAATRPGCGAARRGARSARRAARREPRDRPDRQRDLAGARPLPVAAPVRELRREPHRAAERLQDALHARRSLDDPQRDGHGARRRPGVLDRQVARGASGQRPAQRSTSARRRVRLTACALKCTICACLCGWQYQRAERHAAARAARRDRAHPARAAWWASSRTWCGC